MLPREVSNKISKKVLGSKYDLSLAYIDDETSCTLNQRYRNKNSPTNILSFPLSDHEGEIVINLSQIKREALILKKSEVEHTLYIFIHGLLHLKGFAHGSRMEAEEHKLLKHFLPHVTNHHRRIGYRNHQHSSGGMRHRERKSSA